MDARSSRPLAAAAWAGLLQGAASITGCQAPSLPAAEVTIEPAAPAPPETDDPEPPRPRRAKRPPLRGNCCAGKNDCKGRGGCKTAHNDCKGKNDCKSRGGCRSSDCPP